MAEMVIFTLKSVAALHESTFLCNAAIVARHACPSCLPAMPVRYVSPPCPSLFVVLDAFSHARPDRASGSPVKPGMTIKSLG